LERQGAKAIPLKIMTKMQPWMMSAATPEDCAAIEKRLPLLFRWLNAPVWQRSYQRHATWVG
jgi:hypothetical protein